MKAIETSQRILQLAKNNEELAPELTPLKMQKLLFYVQAWYAANKKTRLFSDDIYAWQLGPVVPEVYVLYKDYGAKDLTTESIPIEFTDTTYDADIESVLEKYGQMSAYELVARTHVEDVWKTNYNSSNKLIPFEAIKESFEPRVTEALRASAA